MGRTRNSLPELGAHSRARGALAAVLGATVLAASLADAALAAPARAASAPAPYVGATAVGRLTVDAPRQTERASVTVTGKAGRGGTVSVRGGLVPVTQSTEPDGSFAVDVPLRPGRANRLRATARAGRRTSAARIDVRQVRGAAAGTATGRVVDSRRGSPVAGATVRYGKRTATTGGDGRYTVTGLPEGTVALEVRARGRLAGMTPVQIRGGVGAARDSASQALGRAIGVGSAGTARSGPGWRVRVPRGALARRSVLRFTGLRPESSLDVTGGVALVHLSARGARLRRPAAVTVDPGRFGLDPARTRVLLVEHDGQGGLEVTEPQLRRRSDSLGFDARILESQVVLAPESESSDLPCTSFATAAQATRAVNFVRLVVLPFLRRYMGPVSFQLWQEFAEGGVATPTPRQVTEDQAVRQFRDSPETADAVGTVLGELEAAIAAAKPALGPPDRPTSRTLGDLGVGRNAPIDWQNIFSVPGNIAGGPGSYEIDNTQYPDVRDFTGPVTIVPEASGTGVLTRVTAVVELALDVRDAVDLCPGNKGDKIERWATVPLSRLEKTPKRSGGFYGKVVPFEVDVRFDPADPRLRRDVTSAYPGNDTDADGIPQRQPWAGATFKLDNCPEAANPDQADTDGDGTGNRCDTTPVQSGGAWTGSLSWRQPYRAGVSTTRVQYTYAIVGPRDADLDLYHARVAFVVSGTSSEKGVDCTYVGAGEAPGTHTLRVSEVSGRRVILAAGGGFPDQLGLRDAVSVTCTSATGTATSTETLRFPAVHGVVPLADPLVGAFQHGITGITVDYAFHR